MLFVRILENVKVGGGGDPERGTQSGTAKRYSGAAVLFLRTLENVRVGGGSIRNGVRNPERGGARSGTGYAIRNGGRG